MENCRIKHAQAWAVEGGVTSWEEGCWVEKNFRMKGAHAWAVQGLKTLGQVEVLVQGDH